MIHSSVRRRTSNRWIPLVFVAALLDSTIVFAQSSTTAFSREEILSLPKHCQAQKFIFEGTESPLVTSAERRYWEQTLGTGYNHFHHYCWALMKVRRAAQATSPQERSRLYHGAIEDLDYVQRNAGASFPLAPEIALRKGMTLQLLGDEGAATREFMKAIKLKRDYSLGYAALIDQYVRLGLVEEARELVEEGLRHAPGSRILQQKKAELLIGKQPIHR